MSKILPDGFVNTDILNDFSVFSLNNSVIGQYAGKVIKGNNNLIIGNNACRIGVDINNSIFLGTNAGSKLLSANQVISIGDDNSSFRKLNKVINIGNNNEITESSNIISITNDRSLLTPNKIGFHNKGISDIIIGNNNSNTNSLINIGTSNISTINNSIIIGNNINNDRFTLNIDNLLLANDNKNNKEVIYFACGAYKDFPIILGSSNNFVNESSLANLSLDRNFITSVFKVKNSGNNSISFKTTANINLIYNFPDLPTNYEYAYLSTDNLGNLFWLPIDDDMIKFINTSADVFCNDLNAINIGGDGRFITNVTVNFSKNTTDDLREGLKNLYSSISLISNVFYNYLQGISSTDLNEGNKNIYYSLASYSSNFQVNLKEFTTDNIQIIEKSENTNKFYTFDEYEKSSSNYLISPSFTTDKLKEGQKNLYYDPNKITFNFDAIKEGKSNLYFNSSNSSNYDYLINSNFNIKTSDNFREGSLNFYYNNQIITSRINFTFNNLTTDDLTEGSNLFVNNLSLFKYLSSNYPTTDGIKQGIINDYFSNINNSNKYQLISDDISEGTSNIYYKNPRELVNLISSISTTDTFKEGQRNLYYYENIGVSNFVSNISKIVTTDNIIEGTSNKFIQNNFYNNNLEINGFLQTNNLNIIDNPINFLVGIAQCNLNPTIGPNTEVFNIYDYDRLFVNSRLSNIEIYYSNANPNIANPTVPFIIINDNVGINMTNPKYNLDVNGTINCSNLIVNNGNLGIGISTPIEKLHVNGNIIATGTITQGFSDMRLKSKIGVISEPFEIINNIEPFYYKPNNLAKSLGFINDKIEIGLNAQEVKKYLPEVVSIAPFDLNENFESKSGNNYLTISYERLVPLLIQGLKDLKKEVSDLKKQLNIDR